MDDPVSIENAHFDQQKATSLNRVDLSKKGGVDEPIRALIDSINHSPHFFTTSSCSGRAVLYSYSASDETKKSDCRWHFTTHGPVDDYSRFASALEAVRIANAESPLVFKFEPFIVHVQCRSLSGAKSLHTRALESGYRNSGLTLGKGGKVTVAVRSTLCLETPLGPAGALLVSDEYLRYLVMDVVREKFERNAEAVLRFETEVKSVL